MPKTIIYSCAAMLFVGALPMPYGYYTLLRLVAFGTFAFTAFIAFERKSILLPWLFGFAALVFNPFIKVHLAKDLWMFIDVLAGLFLVISAKYIQSSDQKETRKMDDLTKKEPQEYLNLSAWGDQDGPSAMKAMSEQQPLTLERFIRNCSSGVRNPTECELANMKTVPDPLLKLNPPTPELLRQFAMQSRAAADEMQKKDKENHEVSNQALRYRTKKSDTPA